jgi:hypothetical protein
VKAPFPGASRTAARTRALLGWARSPSPGASHSEPGKCDQGLKLPDIEAVQEEAARLLVDMAKDAVRGRRFDGFGRGVDVEVRDEDGLELQAKVTFEIDWKRQ